MPIIKETLRAFDSRAALCDKLQELEDENKRLNKSLQEESRLREAFMEQAKREIQRTEKLMDKKIAEIHQDAIESMQKVAAINNNLAVALCDKDSCLKKMNCVAVKLKTEQEKDRCRCKYASNICQKLRSKNEELEKEKREIILEIERIKAENEQLKNDVMECKNKINSLTEVTISQVVMMENMLK